MRNVSAACRYGHQDFYRLTGRDPDVEPMSAVELAIFCACLQEHLEAEWSPKQVTIDHTDD